MLAASGTDLSPLYTYGPLGIFAAFGLWFIKVVVDGMKQDRDAEREYSRKLEESLRTQIIPLLTSVQATTAEAIRVIADLKAELSVMQKKGRP